MNLVRIERLHHSSWDYRLLRDSKGKTLPSASIFWFSTPLLQHATGKPLQIVSPAEHHLIKGGPSEPFPES
jgi:hypothetical protein